MENKKETRTNTPKIQEARVIWLTGLPGTGKTTLGKYLEEKFIGLGFKAYLLDENRLQFTLNKDLDTAWERNTEGLRRIAEVAQILFEAGSLVLVAAISPTREAREAVRRQVGEGQFIEVYLECSDEVRETRLNRGVLGLNENLTFNQISESSFEVPIHPDLHIYTDSISTDEALKKIMNYIIPDLISSKVNTDFLPYNFLIL